MAEYYTKKEIGELDSNQLVTAFENSVCEETKAVNFKPRVPQKLAQQTERLREEIISRMIK